MTAWIDKKFINLVSHRFRDFRWRSTNLANARCPFCGDSQSHKNKRRGYFYIEDDSFVYFCHNGCGKMTIQTVLKKLDLRLFQEYQLESFDKKVPDKFIDSTTVAAHKFDHGPFYSRLQELKKIDDLSTNHIARQYLDHRRIPKSQYSVLRWCPDFMWWTNRLKPDSFKIEHLVFDEGRVLIPYFSADNKFFAYVGRSLNPSASKRYILVILSHQYPLIYGLNHYNAKQKAYAVEGPIDSMFLPNCVALSGANMFDLTKLTNHSNITLIFDNEPHSSQTKDKISLAIDLGYTVCVWPRWVEFKDINQMVMNGWTSDYIKDVIDTNSYDGLLAKMKLEEWSLK